MSFDYSTYLSPLTWRYGSPEMRQIWSETHKRCTWRRIWVAVAEVQSEFGLVTQKQLADLQSHAADIDIDRALEIEADIRHDLMAEIKTFAEQCPIGGGIIHLGMTSTDIVDNTDALRVRESLDLLLARLAQLLRGFADQIEKWAETPVMAFTHLQPAEPTTLGFRLAQYAQDLLLDWENLNHQLNQLKGKGIRGAVGTSASFADLIGVENLAKFEEALTEKLNLSFHPVTTQVYPRKQDFNILSALAGLGASVYKFAFDLRLLQSPPVGELAEPFGTKQVGSSAMPFKRNPVTSENINSLARLLAQYPRTAWDNAAHTLLERTLDDSANRRVTLAEPFLIADQILTAVTGIVQDLRVNEKAISANMASYGPFAGTERVLMAAVMAGADRQTMHKQLRRHALRAWEAVNGGQTNPLIQLVKADPVIAQFIPPTEIDALLDASHHVGIAPQGALLIAKQIYTQIED
jgi:adenylosuccinate lyase